MGVSGGKGGLLKVFLHVGDMAYARIATALVVEDLKTYFYTRRGVVKAVDGVSLRSTLERRWRW